MTLDGNSITEVPNQGEYDVDVVCDDKNAIAYWDYKKWGIFVNNISHVKVKCVIEFKTGRHFNHYIMSLANTNTEVVKIEHEATDQTPVLTDYRYTGSNPNNYVYFGCSDICTEENLYRIIGVIPTQSSSDGPYEPRVKLIKATFYEGESAESSKLGNYTPNNKGYNWNKNGTNQWENSSLKDTLNEEFWNSLGESQKYIEPAKWYLGAPNSINLKKFIARNYYLLERSDTRGYSGGEISFIANIGLMYPSDYSYSINKDNYEHIIYENGELYKANAWLYGLEDKFMELLLTPDERGEAVYFIGNTGLVRTHLVNDEWEVFLARPTFYLKSKVLLEKGNGTKENPYRIKL